MQSTSCHPVYFLDGFKTNIFLPPYRPFGHAHLSFPDICCDVAMSVLETKAVRRARFKLATRAAFSFFVSASALQLQIRALL
jgi:hypothetical protein